MVISDLYSAGCPSGARLSEDPDNAEVESRIIEALPYLKHIQNTSIFWGVRTTLRDLYGWEEPLTTANWRRLDARIRERAGDPYWPLTILKRAGIHRQVTELWRGRDGSANDLFQYSLEWAFFARAQWGQNDIPLFELEKAWNEQIPSPPLPVTLSQRPPWHRRSVPSKMCRMHCNIIANTSPITRSSAPHSTSPPISNTGP